MNDYVIDYSKLNDNTIVESSESKSNDPINLAVKFSTKCDVVYANQEIVPLVHAIVQLHGIVFTQGINEMQTFANISNSQNVYHQIEINNYAILKLTKYYINYQLILSYQLNKTISEVLKTSLLMKHQNKQQQLQQRPNQLVKTKSMASINFNKSLSKTYRNSIKPHNFPSTNSASSSSYSISTDNKSEDNNNNEIDSDEIALLELLATKYLHSVEK